MHPRYVVLLISGATGVGCGSHGPTTSAREYIDPREVILRVSACVREDDKPAACSIVFDDVRESHLRIAAPELEARGFRGTFNLNTAAIDDWAPWQRLFDVGHELANHTRNHRPLVGLTADEIDAEIAGGKADLLAHIAGMHDVPTFTYPNGSRDSVAVAVAARYHMKARGGGGINPSMPPDRMLLGGSEYYEPFNVDVMNRILNAAIAEGGWYLPYFHSIGDGPAACPTDVFTAHLDAIASVASQVWIAPQGVIARYIRERDHVKVEIVGNGPYWLRADTGLDRALYDVPLTLRFDLVPNHGIVRLIVGEVTVDVASDQDVVRVRSVPGNDLELRLVRAR